MKNLLLKFLAVVIVAGALSAIAYAGDPIQNEYLRAADRLRAWATKETDPAKREEYLNQADEYERMAEENAPIEPDSPLPDDSDENAQVRAAKVKSRQEQMRRDLQRWRNTQEILNDPNCADCFDRGYDDNIQNDSGVDSGM